MEASVKSVLFPSIAETSTGYQQSYNSIQGFPVYNQDVMSVCWTENTA